MLFLRAISVLVLVAGLGGVVVAQQRVDPQLLGERVLVVVPMVGAGTAEDPVRPSLVPRAKVRGSGTVAGRADDPNELGDDAGILSWRYEVSADGKTALVELVARDGVAAEKIRALNRADVKIFELGKAKREEIEAEFRKIKPGFDGKKFGDGDSGREPAGPVTVAEEGK